MCRVTSKSAATFFGAALYASIFSSSFLIDAVSHQAAAESMKSAVKRAIRNHPDQLSAQREIAATAYELEATKGSFLPELQGFGEVGVENIYNPNSLSSFDNGNWNAPRQVGVSMSYVLFDGYRRANTVYQQAARLDASIYNLLSASDAIALNTTEAYVDVVRHRDLLRIARQNITRHLDIQRQIKERVRGGKSPISDQFQIEERVFAAKAVKVEIEKALADANAKYRKVVGIKPGRKMRVPTVKGLPKSLKTLVSRSIANNAEIKTLGKAANAAQYETDASQSVLQPTVSLEGRLAAGADRSGSRGGEREAYLGFKLNWKLYDGGTSSAQTSALAERAGQAQLRRDLKIREVRELSEKSWNSFKKGRERSAILRAQMNANIKIVKNYREEYQLTKRSLLDVLDAERARFNSEFQYISISASYRFAQFRMLATQTKLARYFGARTAVPKARPTFERQVQRSSQSIFNINIEPLK